MKSMLRFIQFIAMLIIAFISLFSFHLVDVACLCVVASFFYFYLSVIEQDLYMTNEKTYQLVYLSKLKGYQLKYGFIDVDKKPTYVKSTYHGDEQQAKRFIIQWMTT